MSIKCFSEKGYTLEYKKGVSNSAAYNHMFCGNHKIPGAECPSCKRKLMRFFTLDIRDPLLGVVNNPMTSGAEWKHIKNIHLLYCWRCGQSITYRLLGNDGVEVLEGPDGCEGPDYPYPGYPEYFPLASVTLREIPEKVADLIGRHNNDKLNEDEEYDRKNEKWLLPRHQYGGEPYLVQGSSEDLVGPCSSCGGVMLLLASVGDKNVSRKGFTDDEYVQVIFFLCTKCRILTAFNMCD